MSTRPQRKSAAAAKSRLDELGMQDELDDDDYMLGPDAAETGRGFDILEVVERGSLSEVDHVLDMRSGDFTLEYVQSSGHQVPLRFRERTHLDMKLPPPSFGVSDVEALVGGNRVIDAMDCTTQEALQLTLSEWVKYYTDPDKTRLLNVISLEFSLTKLDKLVVPPRTVRQIDWIDIAWPKAIKQSQSSTGNSMKWMKYPKVQKYCLMSVGGCYTDFHIDFGGTSVWYHVLRGTKIFWLVPPTPENIKEFEKWSKHTQEQIFFGDLVSHDCTMVTLRAGDTFMIPTGWIHAVYTPENSLVFGGNFLHGFGVKGQLEVARIESRLKVPVRYRFPFFQELMWYACVMYRDRLSQQLVDKSTTNVVSLYERNGLASLIAQLHVWAVSPVFSKAIPASISDPAALLDETESMLQVVAEMPDSQALLPSDDSELPTAERWRKKIGTATGSEQVSRLPVKLESDMQTSDAEHYAQLKLVQEGILRAHPGSSPKQVRELALSKWHGLSAAARAAFKSILTQVHGSQDQGVCSDLSSAVDRPSKYARPAYRAPESMVAHARQIKGRVLEACISGEHEMVAWRAHLGPEPKRSNDEMIGWLAYNKQKWRLQRGARAHQRTIMNSPRTPDCADLRRKAPSRPRKVQGCNSTSPAKSKRKRRDDNVCHACVYGAHKAHTCGKRGRSARQHITAAEEKCAKPTTEKPCSSTTVGFCVLRDQSLEKDRSQFAVEDTSTLGHCNVSSENHVPGHENAVEKVNCDTSGPESIHQRSDRVVEKQCVTTKHALNKDPEVAHQNQTAATHAETEPRHICISKKRNVDTTQSYQGSLRHMRRSQSTGKSKNASEQMNFTPDILPVVASSEAWVSIEFKWLSLPEDAWQHILAYLATKDRLRCGMTCWKLHRIVMKPGLWEEVDMSWSKTTTACLSKTASLQPGRVKLGWTRLTDDDLHNFLTSSHNLREIDLTGCPQLSSPCFALGTSGLGLTSVNLNFVPGVNDDSLVYLQALRGTLRTLRLAGTAVSNLEIASALHVLHNLEELDLYQCVNVSDGAFEHVTACCQRLRAVDLRGTNVTAAVLLNFRAGTTSVALDLRDCQSVTRDVVDPALLGAAGAAALRL